MYTLHQHSDDAQSSTATTENMPSGNDNGSGNLSYEELQEIASYIRTKTKIRPKIGIICGSGLGGLADDLDTDRPRDVIPYKDIPQFPNCQG